MNVSLTPDLEELVQQKVKSGRYQSANEVVRAALQLLEQQDMQLQMRLEQLRREVAIGIEQSERGEVFDGSEVVRELLEEIEQEEQAEA